MADEDLGTIDDLVGGTFEELAGSLRKLAHGLEQIEQAGLTRRAIVLLLNDATGIGKRDVETLLEALPKLKERYLTPVTSEVAPPRKKRSRRSGARVHLLGCDEMHGHTAPKCCDPSCWCLT